jgi:hypothetical protein
MTRTIVCALFLAATGLAACTRPAPPPAETKSPERLAAERACTRVEVSRYSGEGWYYAFKTKVVDQRCVERRLRANK